MHIFWLAEHLKILDVLCAADSMDSSSKLFVSADDVAVMNGDSNAGTYIACTLHHLLYISTIIILLTLLSFLP